MKVYQLPVIIIGWLLEEIKEVENETEFQKLKVRHIFANGNVEKKKEFSLFQLYELT